MSQSAMSTPAMHEGCPARAELVRAEVHRVPKPSVSSGSLLYEGAAPSPWRT